MLLKAQAAQRALAAPDPAVRLFVLAGPDEAASRALIDSFAKAMGPEAERVDLAQRQIQDMPSCLADEVGAFSLFGGRRWLLITLTSGSGDEWLEAASHVLEAETTGNPAIITGGGMTAKAKLVKLAEAHPAAVAVVSYLPDEKDRARLAADIANTHGLTLSRDVARAMADATGGDRGLMVREAEKLAVFLDVSADGPPRRVEIDDWLAIGADTPEEDVGAAVNLILDGRTQALPALFEELTALGTSDIRLVRMLTTRAVLLARVRARIDGQRMSPKGAVDQERGLFWKEKDAVERQLNRWTAPALARLVDRLHALERALKAPDNAGMLLLRSELLHIARAAAAAR
jgi:DNA polymerase-3 subunit delta